MIALVQWEALASWRLAHVAWYLFHTHDTCETFVSEISMTYLTNLESFSPSVVPV